MSYWGGGVLDAQADYTSAETDTVIVADPGTGLSIGVIAVWAMSDTAGIIFLEDTTTTKFRGYPGANGGWDKTAPDGEFLFKVTASEALTVTSDIAGNHSVHILYKLLLVP